jgi:hypothetical protein
MMAVYFFLAQTTVTPHSAGYSAAVGLEGHAARFCQSVSVQQRSALQTVGYSAAVGLEGRAARFCQSVSVQQRSALQTVGVSTQPYRFSGLC